MLCELFRHQSHDVAVYRRSRNDLRLRDDVPRRDLRLPTQTQRQPEVPTVLAVAAGRRFAAVYGEVGRLAKEFDGEVVDARKCLQFSHRFRVIIMLNINIDNPVSISSTPFRLSRLTIIVIKFLKNYSKSQHYLVH